MPQQFARASSDIPVDHIKINLPIGPVYGIQLAALTQKLNSPTLQIASSFGGKVPARLPYFSLFSRFEPSISWCQPYTSETMKPSI